MRISSATTRRDSGGGLPSATRGQTAAVSIFYASRTDCMRGVAELKVEGPAAPVTYEEPYAARPATWTISSLIPSGS